MSPSGLSGALSCLYLRIHMTVEAAQKGPGQESNSAGTPNIRCVYIIGEDTVKNGPRRCHKI